MCLLVARLFSELLSNFGAKIDTLVFWVKAGEFTWDRVRSSRTEMHATKWSRYTLENSFSRCAVQCSPALHLPCLLLPDEKSRGLENWFGTMHSRPSHIRHFVARFFESSFRKYFGPGTFVHGINIPKIQIIGDWMLGSQRKRPSVEDNRFHYFHQHFNSIWKFGSIVGCNKLWFSFFFDYVLV